MKINKKALQLIEKGLSSKTVSKLSESQIDVLHSKLLSEQSTAGTTMVPRTDSAKIQQLKNQKQTFQVYEKELEEEDEVTIDPNKDTETQDPHQVGPSSDDGFGNETDDGMGMFEEEYKDGPNPWAICHAQVGPKKTRKFERCVMAVKKQLKEGKNPVSLFLENQITKIVEKHIPPRITKGDLMKYISESSPAPTTKPAPTKPDVKPTTKPRPSHPGKNPNERENPAPKADKTGKKRETKEANSPAPTTKPAPTKPGVKPTTRPKPSHPGKNPNERENPAPKASKVSAEDAKEKVIDTIMNLLQK
jgi:pyruvate/2-oxoglutarate dehydrogenase complex dihydrolipoamide acyltransferase (E2) component